FYFGSGEEKDSVIENFTIKNGKKDGASYPDSTGGAILCENNSSPAIVNCAFSGNSANWSGGAIYCENSSSGPTVTNCTFSGNSANGDGGAISCWSYSSPTLSNCTFSGNSANGDGGAIYCVFSDLSITGCTFSGNGVVDYGGAIYCWESSLVLTNCAFSGNSANGDGGAVYCKSCTSSIVNCTFSANRANWFGGAIECYSNGSVILNNCILWGNLAGIGGDEIYISDSGSSCTLNSCCVDNTGYGGQRRNITENNCIYDDPQFVDTANGDYHLKDVSPCIDAGDNSLVPSAVNKDLGGDDRVVDGDNDGNAVVDIGAYEYQLSLQITATTLPDGEEGVSYPTTTLNATGGTPPYTWSVSGLPSGLTWSQVGDAVEISGTPASGTAGTHDVDVTVSDSSSPTQSVSVTLQLVVNPAGSGTTWYVDGINGSDSNGGSSWSDAFATIGKALSVAGDYDLVLVADATYNETDLNFNGKKIYLKGVDHNNAGQRPVIDCQGKGRAFYFGSGETKDSVVDNFTIKNGVVFDDGGALYCCDDSSPTITNCTFSGNSAGCGGAIYCCDNSSPTITNCTFSGNSAGYGAAIYCNSFSRATVIDCVFSDNSAWDGSAIYCYDKSRLTLVGCAFSGNKANNDGGAIYCDCRSPSITGCTFSHNSATRYGGAIYCYSSSRATVTNCTFSSNSAFWGGAICCFASSPILTNCLFSGNSVTGVTFSYGGAICCEFGNPRIKNCTFSGNSAGDGGAIYCFDNSTMILDNCILWGDSAGSSGNEIYIDATSSCTLNFCCVENKGYGGGGSIDDTNNCISADPQFVDPKNGDFHLESTSPCIDTGENSLVPSGVDKDLNGKQRTVDGNNDGKAIVDIGAYEYQP
ncbi:MAG: hypothetical protein DRP63_09565, partial [Planctomycetota bacterium]